jgi:hypothetical protein
MGSKVQSLSRKWLTGHTERLYSNKLRGTIFGRKSCGQQRSLGLKK